MSNGNMEVTSERTYLEGHKPDALDCIPNEQEILHRSQGRDIYTDVHKGNANEAFIGIESSNKYLRDQVRCETDSNNE